MINKTNKKYDLEERTALFAENIIDLCKKIPKNIITIPIIGQLVRSGTSIGTNYCEANGASSKKDFRVKIFICKKEAKESKYWLKMLLKTVEISTIKLKIRRLSKEAHELLLIFSKIASSSS